MELQSPSAPFTVTREALDILLARVEKPTRYTGGELNAIKKDLATTELVWAFAFPDAYDIGMNNLGLQILYQVLNARPDIACERVFAPWVDMEAQMRARGIPLFTLENRALVRTLDLFAFTIPYEIILSNVVNMIELAGMPLYAKDRDASYPLVIGGGAVAMNPEPIADFFDLFVIGEGEEVVIDISDAVLAWKRGGTGDKTALLETLRQIEGVYVPAFFEPVYREDGRLEAIRPRIPSYKRTMRRIVENFDTAVFPTAPVVPTLKTIHDRLALEITRGCTAGCRFCQAGMITRPTRERSPETILSLVDESLKNTGYSEVSLNSLSSGDYSCINSLLELVNSRYNSQMVSATVPSLRVKSLTPEVARAVATVKKGGFTIAPEAGSQRMRNAINKDVTDEELVRTVDTVFSSGGQGVKMYFMCGLPGEEDQDLDGIINLGVLAYQTARKHHSRPNVTISVSTFVPKPFTPFQWSSQVTREETLRKQRYLKEKLRPYRAITMRWHEDYGTYLEGLFSRGDRRLSKLLEVAQRLGCRFDGWQEHIRQDLWAQAFQEAGVDPMWYLRERALEEVLPWDHIECRVSKKFLKNEWARAQMAFFIPDCRWGECAPCGACHKEVKITTFDGQDPRQSSPPFPPGEGRTYRHPIAQIPELPEKPALADGRAALSPVAHLAKLPWRKIRFRYEKVGPARFIGHLELTQVFARALRRLGVQLRYSQGFHPMPRIIFSNPLPVGVESRIELVDLDVVEESGPISGEELMARLNDRQLPEGLRIREVVTADFPINGMASISFTMHLPAEVDPLALAASVGAFLETEVQLVKKKKQVLNARPLVERLEADGRTLRMELATPISGAVRPTDLLAILMPGLDPADVRVVKEDCRFATALGRAAEGEDVTGPEDADELDCSEQPQEGEDMGVAAGGGGLLASL